ncbi:hypothetical protein RFI_08057 [Reticulomyxa filosa]|uniref:Citrate synthase n=1 Tax=Reticulomyxa filosa TaxID=46433 RepID=X6NTI7_RETFI|nr:hypothetical protein RFI_08057 [Reticulomyxa filosa]|eukprot:ETO29069.1 hypothetical protein RFI_08057 [Reticulomyxa filosa]
MLEEIGDRKNVPSFIEKVKAKKVKLMGFGHRVYKAYDPRAKVVRKMADRVFAIVGREPLIEIAEDLEKTALSDPYFVKRNLYPNIDFYSGLIYKALGFPTDFFTVLFTIPRTVGWLAHWNEFLDDKDNRIVRPRQIFLGHKRRIQTQKSNPVFQLNPRDGLLPRRLLENRETVARFFEFLFWFIIAFYFFIPLQGRKSRF